jgi:hypothetical protein
MKKLTHYALTGAMVAAVAGTIALTADTTAEAGSHGVTPVCLKLVKMPSDRAQAAQLRAVYGRLGPLSGYCGLPR